MQLTNKIPAASGTPATMGGYMPTLGNEVNASQYNPIAASGPPAIDWISLNSGSVLPPFFAMSFLVICCQIGNDAKASKKPTISPR